MPGSGDVDAAVGHLERAVELSERIGAPYWVAQARLDLARVLAAHADPADAPTVRALTDAALAAAHAGGYGRILERAPRVR